MAHANQTVICDNGSSSIKAGFAGEDAPKTVFPKIIGETQPAGVINYPMQDGVVSNWEDMIKIWNHIFSNELRISPKEYRVLLTEPPVNSKANREHMAQIMFEKFEVPHMLLANQAVLSLYASGSISGVAVHSGDKATYTVPIHDGYPIHHGVQKLHLSGHHVTDFMMKKLTEKGYSVSTTSIARDIKEQFAYVAVDYEKEVETVNSLVSLERRYQLPDGQTITISAERFMSPELLFQPDINDLEYLGIHDTTNNSIMQCSSNFRKTLYGNIVLSGGSTMFPGFADRMSREMTALAPSAMNVNIAAPPHRKYSVWLGGSIVASLNTQVPMWIPRSAYHEDGPQVVNRRFI